jgi:hypothetical protein
MLAFEGRGINLTVEAVTRADSSPQAAARRDIAMVLAEQKAIRYIPALNPTATPTQFSLTPGVIVFLS